MSAIGKYYRFRSFTGNNVTVLDKLLLSTVKASWTATISGQPPNSSQQRPSFGPDKQNLVTEVNVMGEVAEVNVTAADTAPKPRVWSQQML